MSRELGSLILVEERLLEAKYFAEHLRILRFSEFQYEFNAFLSSARSVTWLLQKEMAHVEGFSEWWKAQQREMARDEALRFFLKLRNFSQKEGRISVVGSDFIKGGQESHIYLFAGNKEVVPEALLYRNIVDCCLEHIQKLADIVLNCSIQFPFHTCPHKAITVEGLKALNLDLEDIVIMLGLPENWVNVVDIPEAEKVRILQSHFDGVDFGAIRELAEYPLNTEQIDQDRDNLSFTISKKIVDSLEKSRIKNK